MKELEILSREIDGVADGLRDLKKFVESRKADLDKHGLQGYKIKGCAYQLMRLLDSSEAVAIWTAKEIREMAKKSKDQDNA